MKHCKMLQAMPSNSLTMPPRYPIACSGFWWWPFVLWQYCLFSFLLLDMLLLGQLLLGAQGLVLSKWNLVVERDWKGKAPDLFEERFRFHLRQHMYLLSSNWAGPSDANLSRSLKTEQDEKGNHSNHAPLYFFWGEMIQMIPSNLQHVEVAEGQQNTTKHN